MHLDTVQYLLGVLSGGLVGFSLGLFGGGGSILAVPLMVYLVGVANPHMAVGTSAFAVAVNAMINLVSHARLGTVKWRCAALYSSSGVLGALLGSSIGKMIDGQKLLVLFGALMLVVSALMLKRRQIAGNPGAQCNAENAPKVLSYGGATGMLSGFFGIGGGFLIVPGLIGSTGMPIANAVGTSLVAVSALGLTTAGNYAVSGQVDWILAGTFISGGILGGVAGSTLCQRLAASKGTLSAMLAILIFAVGLYVVVKGVIALWWPVAG